MRIKHPPLTPYSINGKLFIPIAKNAHRSVVQAIKEAGGKKEYWNKLPGLPRVVLLREPMDRLYSTYRMFITDGTIHDTTFDYFVSRLLAGKRIASVPPDDMHLQTQWAAMGERKPDISVKWDISTLAEILGLSEIPHLGKSLPIMGRTLSQQAQGLFNDYYRKDVELWNDRHTNGDS